jgi:hypothetical protein
MKQIQEIKLYHPNPKIEEFYHGWAKKVNLVTTARYADRGGKIEWKYAKLPNGKHIPWKFEFSNFGNQYTDASEFVCLALAAVAKNMGFKQRAIAEVNYGEDKC